MLYRNEPVLTESYRNDVMDEIAADICTYICEARWYEENEHPAPFIAGIVDNAINLYDLRTSLGW